ncbi:MAG: GAF domain-containing protein [Chloroflexi bacterium]|nr:GAF domain-containing protein [Chloroflexota bacterium]
MTRPEEFQALYSIARALHQQKLDVARILQTLLTLTAEAIGVRHGCAVTFNEGGQLLDAFVLPQNVNGGSEYKPWQALLQRGLIGFVRHSKRRVTIRDLATDPRWPRLPANPHVPANGSAIGLPLLYNGYVAAALLLIHPQPEYFTGDKVALLDEIMRVANSALDNALDFQNAYANMDTRHLALFDEALVPIILTDLQGYIVNVNNTACGLLSCEAGDLLGLPIAAVHRLEGDSLVQQSIQRALQNGQEIEFRTTAGPNAKEGVPVLMRARRRMFGNLDVVEWIAQDLSSQLELEQLRQDLAAMVYHDLRGPLQAIKGSLQKLSQFLLNYEAPTVPTLLQIGLRSTKQLQRMVDSLLDIQRMEEGKAVLNKKQTLLRDLLAEAVQLVLPLATDAEQNIKFEPPKELVFVEVDGDMLIRVITNLIENAIKYTPSGGTIRVSATLMDGRAQVSVKDSGPGIPTHMQGRVFDKFSRVKYKDVPKGVGLGLAFCRLAVEAHGGRIWVESEPGNGADFLFTLPVLQNPAPEDSLVTKADTHPSRPARTPVSAP